MNNRKWLKLVIGLLIASILLVAATQRFDTIVAKKIVIVGSGGFELGDNAGSFDLNGKELTLDADDDSSFTADTDDQLDLELNGQDEYVFTAGVFDVGEGTLSRIDLDADNDTSIRSSADDRIDFELNGTDTYSATASNIYLNGKTLTVDADQDTTMVASVDDVLSMTLGASTGFVNVATGNLKVGNGTPGVTLNGEDLYVEGTIEADGQITTDGGMDLNGSTVIVDADADTNFASTLDDVITVTLGAGTGAVDIATGNLRVGNGTPDSTINGEDLYVEGISEFDGLVTADGGIDLNGSTATYDSDATVSSASLTGNITYTLAATGSLDVATGNFKVGNGTPDTAQNGEDAYVEGGLEVDGAVNFDGAVDIDGNLTSATGALTIADTLNTTGAVDFDSTLNVDDATTVVTITITGDAIDQPQATFTVEAGVPITPTGRYQPIDAPAGDLNDVSSIAAPTDDTIGKRLLLHNIDATLPITIDGTGAGVECKADVVLDVQDTLELLWNGDNWVCIANYDNS